MKYKTGRPAVIVLTIALMLTVALALAGAVQGRALLRSTFDGRKASAAQWEEDVSYFTLRAEMLREQTAPQIGGWLNVISSQDVTVSAAHGRLSGTLYPAIDGNEDAPWALVFHGGLGTTRDQVQDIAFELSLAGYRTLTPDLYAHGQSEGEVSSLGGAGEQDVQAWLDYILMQDEDARIVLMGQDEGALGVLLATAQGLPGAVAAVATDSAYLDVSTRAYALMERAGQSGGLSRWLLGLAYRVCFGVAIQSAARLEALAQAQVPMLLVHGTLDDQTPAYLSEDIAALAGGTSQVLFVEGASHGMARYIDPQEYYERLIGFFDEAIRMQDKGRMT